MISQNKISQQLYEPIEKLVNNKIDKLNKALFHEASNNVTVKV